MHNCIYIVSGKDVAHGLWFMAIKVLCRYSSGFAGEVVSNASVVVENASFLFRSLYLPCEVPHWLYILKFTRFARFPGDSMALIVAWHRWHKTLNMTANSLVHNKMMPTKQTGTQFNTSDKSTTDKTDIHSRHISILLSHKTC